MTAPGSSGSFWTLRDLSVTHHGVRCYGSWREREQAFNRGLLLPISSKYYNTQGSLVSSLSLVVNLKHVNCLDSLCISGLGSGSPGALPRVLYLVLSHASLAEGSHL